MDFLLHNNQCGYGYDRGIHNCDNPVEGGSIYCAEHRRRLMAVVENVPPRPVLQRANAMQNYDIHVEQQANIEDINRQIQRINQLVHNLRERAAILRQAHDANPFEKHSVSSFEGRYEQAMGV